MTKPWEETWVHDIDNMVVNDDSDVVVCNADGPDRARLIAAAPELYRALAALLTAATCSWGPTGSDAEELAWAALRKARGGQ